MHLLKGANMQEPQQTPPIVVSSSQMSFQEANALNKGEDSKKGSPDPVMRRGRPKGRKTTSHPHLIRPKRPRSAYNFFFQDERNKVLRAAGLDEAATPALEDVPKADRFKILIKNQYQDNGKRKRGRPPGKHYRPRKTHERHGLIDFRKFPPAIGAKWKSLMPEERKPYEKQAEVERLHYQSAMERYKAEVKIFESCKESGKEDKTVQNSAINTSDKMQPNITENNYAKNTAFLPTSGVVTSQGPMGMYAPNSATSQGQPQQNLKQPTTSHFPMALAGLRANSSCVGNAGFSDGSGSSSSRTQPEIKPHQQDQHVVPPPNSFEQTVMTGNNNGNNCTNHRSEYLYDFGKLITYQNSKIGTVQTYPSYPMLHQQPGVKKTPTTSYTNIRIAGNTPVENKLVDENKKNAFHQVVASHIGQHELRNAQPRNLGSSHCVSSIYPTSASSSSWSDLNNFHRPAAAVNPMTLPSMETSVSSNRIPAASTLLDIVEKDLFCDDNNYSSIL